MDETPRRPEPQACDVAAALLRLAPDDRRAFIPSLIAMLERVAADEERHRADRDLIFRPEPYVRRLVFIATPHGGSPVADGPLGRLGLALSRPQGNTARIGDELDAAYGPGSYNGGLRGETYSLRNLSPSSRVIRRAAQDPHRPERAPPLHRAPVAASYDPRAWRRGGPLRELAPPLGLVGGARSRLPPRGRQAGSHGRTPSNPADPPSGGGADRPAGRPGQTGG